MTSPDPPEPPARASQLEDANGAVDGSPLTRAHARDTVLARLAAHVRTAQAAADRRLGVLEATVAESADLLAQALPRLDTAGDELAALAAQLDQPATAPVTPVCWPTLSIAQAATVWTELADWIEGVLVAWYATTRTQLPDCWALHRPVVLELTWLHTTYREAHTRAARPQLTADWHTRWRPAALTAIQTALGTGIHRCRPGQHTDPTGQLPQDMFTPPPDEPAHGRHVEGRERLLAHRKFWQANYLTAVRLDHDWRHSPPAPDPARRDHAGLP